MGAEQGFHGQESLSTPERLLEGRSALIVGASRGIGLETARAFIDEGIGELHAVSRGPITELAEYAKIYGVSTNHIAADVSTREGVEKVVGNLADYGAKLHAVVLNAGMRGDNMVGNYSWDQLQAVLGTNLVAPIMLTDGIIRRRIFVQGNTSIIINGSVIGEDGQFGGGMYSASKAGLRGFVKSAAMELGSLYGVRVNLVEPGFIDTELVADLTDNPRMNRMMVGATPLGRLGQPDDVADLFVFLASDKSRFINGSIQQVHGGINGYAAVGSLMQANADIYGRKERQMISEYRAAQEQARQQGGGQL